MISIQDISMKNNCNWPCGLFKENYSCIYIAAWINSVHDVQRPTTKQESKLDSWTYKRQVSGRFRMFVDINATNIAQ